MPHRRLTELSSAHDLAIQRIILLACMFTISSGLCILAAVTGSDHSGGRHVLYAAAVVGAAVALALWLQLRLWFRRRRRRLRPKQLQIFLALYSAIVALLAGASDSGGEVTSLGPAVIMTCAYAGCFYTGMSLWLQVAISIGSYNLAALIAAPAVSPTALITATFVATSIAAVLHHLTSLLRRRSLHDPLTGAVSRATWMKITQEAVRTRGNRPLTVALIDLDRFKQINDTLGHLAGDRLLQDLTSTWQQALGGDGLLGRYGGDEFVVLFVNTHRSRAEELLRFMAAAHPAKWTAGLTTARRDDDTHTLLQAADEQLQALKRGSRARCDCERTIVDHRTSDGDMTSEASGTSRPHGQIPTQRQQPHSESTRSTHSPTQPALHPIAPDLRS